MNVSDMNDISILIKYNEEAESDKKTMNVIKMSIVGTLMAAGYQVVDSSGTDERVIRLSGNKKG